MYIEYTKWKDDCMTNIIMYNWADLQVIEFSSSYWILLPESKVAIVISMRKI